MPLFSRPASCPPRGGSRRAIAPAARRRWREPARRVDRSCFLVVAAAVRASARHEIGEELRLDGALFVRQLESRSQHLVAATRLRIKKPRAPSSRTVVFFNDVSFPNRDNIRHHVYSFSSPKKFELPLYIGTPAAPVLFDKPGVVALGSNIHDWMLAYIYVVTTPYFAKTAADGKARLDGLTPGTCEALFGSRGCAATPRRQRSRSGGRAAGARLLHPTPTREHREASFPGMVAQEAPLRPVIDRPNPGQESPKLLIFLKIQTRYQICPYGLPWTTLSEAPGSKARIGSSSAICSAWESCF